MATTYEVIERDEDGQVLDRFTYKTKKEASDWAKKLPFAEVIRVRKYVCLHCDAGQYVAMLVTEAGGSINKKPIRGTASNAGLVARSRAIDAAADRGLDFVE